MRGGPHAGRVIAGTAEPYLRRACGAAADRANISLKDVDCLVVNTPNAWYSLFAAKALGIDPDRTITTYTRYANIGAALMPANVQAAVAAGKIKPGSMVMLYGFGGVGNASAAVLKWGSVAVAQ
jgi:3-oxoacyl-[acyl-carrier-protein] synthase-3